VSGMDVEHDELRRQILEIVVKEGAIDRNLIKPETTLVVAARQYGQKPARLFAKQIGARVLAGRFVPGTLTNPNLPEFIEPEVLVATDPAADQQALREALNVGMKHYLRDGRGVEEFLAEVNGVTADELRETVKKRLARSNLGQVTFGPRT